MHFHYSLFLFFYLKVLKEKKKKQNKRISFHELWQQHKQLKAMRLDLIFTMLCFALIITIILMPVIKIIKFNFHQQEYFSLFFFSFRKTFKLKKKKKAGIEPYEST